jgi:hypothetical protein
LKVWKRRVVRVKVDIPADRPVCCILEQLFWHECETASNTKSYTFQTNFLRQKTIIAHDHATQHRHGHLFYIIFTT